MKLEKRSEGGPVEPVEETEPRGKKPVVLYIMILFIAAFLLMAWSFASHQKSNTEAIGRLQSSVNAMQGVQERVVSLQKELDDAQDQIEDLERDLSLREMEMEAYNRQYQALGNLYTLERLYRQENLAGCREIIDSMEAEDLVVCLSDSLSDSDRELGIAVSNQARYQQLKEAVEAREAEAQGNAESQEEETP